MSTGTSFLSFNSIFLNSYFSTLRQIFDATAMSLLSVECFLLFCVSMAGITLGLIKTNAARGVNILHINSVTKAITLGVLVGALSMTISRNASLDGTFYLLNDMLALDFRVGWAQTGILALAIIFILVTTPALYLRNSYYYEMLLFALTATMLMTGLVMAGNFIIFYLVLEGLSLIFYTIASRTFVYGGVESGLRYFSLGALASVLLLVGVLCVFAATGSTDFLVTSLALKYDLSANTGLLLVIGLTLVAMALFFKLSAFPGHVGTPDVYEGTSLEVLGIFAVLAKFTFVVLFLRFFAIFFVTPTMFAATNFGVATSCIGSLLIGAAGAFLATNLKRFVAYTAINQMGFLFIGLAAISVDGMKSTVTYLYIYMLANVLFFCAITLLQAKKHLLGDGSLRSLKDVTLIKKAPVEMGLLAISLLSLSGLPPLAGFAGKYLLGSSLISRYLQTSSSGLAENLLSILILSVVLSLLSTLYYLRLIKMALFDNFVNEVAPTSTLNGPLMTLTLTATVSVFTLVTIGGFFVLADLDAIRTRLTLAVVAPLGLST